MSLLHPEWLLCLVGVPLVALTAWLAWRKRGLRWQKLVAPRLKNRLSQASPPWVHFTAIGLALTGWAGLVIAMAQPESGEEWIEVENEGRNLLFCIDISRSMTAEDTSPSRLLASRSAALEILEKFPNDRVGVLLFAGEVLVQSPLTIDHGFVENTLAQLDPNDIPVGGSNLTAAITEGTKLLVNTGQQSNIMVIFSDGEESTEGLEKAARAAADEGVFIYALGMGTIEGSFIPDSRERDGKFRDRTGNVVFSRLDEEALQILASETNGYYSRGMGGDFIGRLNSALTEMDRFREEGKYQRVAKPAHQWFVGGGLILLMSSLFVRCLPLRGTIALAAFMLAIPSAKAGSREDGIAALKSGSPAEAHQHFQDAAKEATGDRAAQLYLSAGAAAAKAKDWKLAVASFSEALAADDPDIQKQAHSNLAAALFYLGMPLEKDPKVKAWKGAIEHFEASLEISPDNQAIASSLATVKQQLKNLEPKKSPPKEKEPEKEKPKEEEPKEKEKSKDEGNPESNKPDPKDKPEEPKDGSGQPNQDPKKDPDDEKKPGEPPAKNPENNEDPPDQDEGKSPQDGDPKDGDQRDDKSGEGKEEEDPNAPEGETPIERARRELAKFADFGAKAPRRQRRTFNRPAQDW